jgi:glutathione synthase/RimK-type ligase-like ATP-grasp enzyme
VLTRNDGAVLTVNLEAIADHELTILPGCGVEIDDARVDKRWTVWWRRVGADPDDPRMSEVESQLRREEVEELVLGGLLAAGPRRVDHPHRMANAEHKLVQLAAATASNIQVPRTVATNQPAVAHELLTGGPVVAKAASAGVGLAPHADLLDAASVGRLVMAPTLLQRKVDAVADLRVVVVGHRSWIWRRPRDADAPVDWRVVDPAGEQFTVWNDNEITAAAEGLTSRLGLTVSVQDWLVDGKGKRWFLEVNPAGQWLFLERADELVTPVLASHLARGRAS